MTPEQGYVEATLERFWTEEYRGHVFGPYPEKQHSPVCELVAAHAILAAASHDRCIECYAPRSPTRGLYCSKRCGLRFNGRLGRRRNRHLKAMAPLLDEYEYRRTPWSTAQELAYAVRQERRDRSLASDG